MGLSCAGVRTHTNCQEPLLDMWPSRRACRHLDCGPNNTLLGVCQRGQRRCQKGKGFFPPTWVSCLASGRSNKMCFVPHLRFPVCLCNLMPLPILDAVGEPHIAFIFIAPRAHHSRRLMWRGRNLAPYGSSHPVLYAIPCVWHTMFISFSFTQSVFTNIIKPSTSASSL